MSSGCRLAWLGVALGVWLGAWSAAAQPPTLRVVDVAAAETSSDTRAAERLVAALAAADAVLLGEIHDNAEHHRLQAWLVERLVARGRPVIVAFEMINTDQAADMARHFAAAPSDAAGLGAALMWQTSGWPEWPVYAPIVAAALAQPNPPVSPPVRAAGLPRSFARGVVQQGLDVLPAALAERLALAPEADAAALAAHGKDMDASHCGLLPAAQIAPFALAQYARDAQMALSLADAWRDAGRAATVVLIAGSGHARSDLGVPLHLRRLAPEMRVVSVGMVEADAPRPDLPFDYVLLTAAEPREDPCAELRARGMPRR